jgi:hypothetical protein
LIAEYPVGFSNFPEGLVAGKDGALWLDQYYPNGVARVTTKGVVSQVALTLSNAGGNDLAVGSDGKLWVVDGAGGAVSRLSAIGGKGNLIKPTHGRAFDGAVAKFVDGTLAAKLGDFTASISWGDGSKPSAGTVTGAAGGPFTVKGAHTYAKAGTFKVAVSLHDKVDNSTYLASKGKAAVK